MNWQKAIIYLESCGWSLTSLGYEIGLSPQSLSNMKQGRTFEPRGMAAVRLYKLYCATLADCDAAANRADEHIAGVAE